MSYGCFDKCIVCDAALPDRGGVGSIYALNRKGHHHQSRAAKAARLMRKAHYFTLDLPLEWPGQLGS
jgi:hypothetical protein